MAGRTPQGVRGLKSIVFAVSLHHNLSHPARGAWIEIFLCRYCIVDECVAPRKGCVD